MSDPRSGRAARAGHRETLHLRRIEHAGQSAANFLRDEYGVEKGDRVSILAHNSVAYVDLFYGLAKIGAIFAPLNWRLVARELDLHRQRLRAQGAALRPRVHRAAGRDAPADRRGAYPGSRRRRDRRRATPMKTELASATRAEPERPRWTTTTPTPSCTPPARPAAPKGP